MTADEIIKAGERVGDIIYVSDTIYEKVREGMPWPPHVYIHERITPAVQWTYDDNFPMANPNYRIIQLEISQMRYKPVPEWLRLQEGL